ncbi:hypothetical protein L198_05528 [Cryptococcus wingfieldii CBS 7118]|uniref:Uncharacterized protein n=1 Tax=Cryptococcus wingfieldii CBS 7118 TaxID=1295528 RepID=A0A1E3IVT5_9TREE|nr:hypothetical protein L198_05528 [Cryptococcus wingfieldii CBS 7118]ODN92734.1 hypothetical protein L198_05528 [Cryptococcus wingfieldii CBS 7118]
MSRVLNVDCWTLTRPGLDCCFTSVGISSSAHGAQYLISDRIFFLALTLGLENTIMDESVILANFARLKPVYNHILHHLSLLTLTQLFFLSQYCYDFTIPDIYHDVSLTASLFASLMGGGDSAKRTARALSHTRVLRLPPYVVLTGAETDDCGALTNPICKHDKPTPLMPLSFLPQTPIFGGIRYLMISASSGDQACSEVTAEVML